MVIIRSQSLFELADDQDSASCRREVGTMTYIGFDHHKKWTQAAAIDDQGKVIREMRILNDSRSLKGFLSRQTG